MSLTTSDEINTKMVETLGPEFGSLFFALRNEIIWLTLQWIEYKELYGKKESRIELMNETAPFFFYTIQRVLWNHLMLGVSRITDPPKNGRNRNVTLKAIKEYLEDENFQNEIISELTKLNKISKFCRDWRNKKIAHMDYDLAINVSDVKPLEIANREKLEIVIGQIQALYSKVHEEFFGSQIDFSLMNSTRGAKALLHRIEDSIMYNKEVYNRKLNGDWDWSKRKESRV